MTLPVQHDGARAHPSPHRHRWAPAATLAAIAYLPLLLTHPGMVGADTKQYLYLDPSRLITRAATMWDPNVGMGTVTHENIGYLFPMGPFYWMFHALSVPTWIAQRLWTGSLLFLAGLGVLFLLRTLGWRQRAALLAGLAYMLSPYVLEYEARISAILMPWAALPWMIGLTYRAVRNGGWRTPALFAIVAAVAGSVNATSLIYAGLGPVILIPFVVWVTREVTVRHALSAAGRIGVLTLACSAWWITGLYTQAHYGMNVLRFTETVKVVSIDATTLEALRGLGNWYFYGGDAVGPWINVSRAYTQWLWLLAVSYAVPILAFAAAFCIRWRYKLYFVSLILSGVALTALVHPYSHPSPVGSVFKSFAATSTFGLALRSTPRAVPLVALGVAVLLAGGVDAFATRFPTRAGLATGLVVGLVVADMYPLWTGNLVDKRLQRPDQVPLYWHQAAAYLNSRGAGTRVLEEPGADFSHYRWGTTLDPVTPGLMDRPFVGRELIPFGSPPSADLLIALDRRLQEGSFDTAMLAPIARLMSAGDVLLRSDLQYERFLTPRPRPTWALFSPTPPPGLVPGPTFGPPASRQTVIPLFDELTLSTDPNLANPPTVAAFGVPGARPIIRAETTDRPMIVAGSGDGLVDSAAVGLLDANPTILYSANLDADPRGFTSAMSNGADLVVTDSNRRRAWRWGTVNNNTGYTERAGEKPLVADPSDNRLIVFPGTTDDAATVTVQRGGLTVSATGYGGDFSYGPGARAANALDGDPTTSWTAAADARAAGQALHVDLDKPLTADHINLVQPLVGSRNRYITKVTFTFDGQRSFHATLGKPSRTAAGQTVTFPSGPIAFQHLVIRIDATGSDIPHFSGNSGVGFASVSIGDAPPVVDEIVRLPVDLLDRAGAASLGHRLVLVLTRQRGNPSDAFSSDDEIEIKRTFTLPTSRTFGLGGEARIDPNASSATLTDLLDVAPGATPDVTAHASSMLPGSLTARPSDAIDANNATAWTTSLGNSTGQSIALSFAQPTDVDHLDLSIVADGKHSVPTKLLVRPGKGEGPPQVLTVPPITDQAQDRATVPVHLRLARPLTAITKLSVTLASLRRIQTKNYAGGGSLQTMPVAIAELGLPTHLPAPPVSIPDACRTDLLRVDGQPVGIRVIGSRSDAITRTPLKVEPCGSSTNLVLGPGSHLLEASPGHQTGIDLDRLVLASERGGSAITVGPLGQVPVAGAAAGPAVQIRAQGRTWADVNVDLSGNQKPFWVVLGQSFNNGWAARADGVGNLDGPKLVDGFANGWLVRPPPGATHLTIHLRWTPQHRVDWGIRLSGVAILACLLLSLLGRRRMQWLGHSPTPRWVSPLSVPSAPASPRATVLFTVAATIVAAGLIGPLPGLLVGAAALAVARRPRVRPMVAACSLAGLIGGAGYVLATQLVHHPKDALNWATHFGILHVPIWIVIALLVVSAAAEQIPVAPTNLASESPAEATAPLVQVDSSR